MPRDPNSSDGARDPGSRFGEPEEYDPEARWGDPEHDLPKIPQVGTQEELETVEFDVSSDVAQSFWAAVVFANVALLGLSLGPMLIFFRGQWTLGLVSIGIGLLGLLGTYRVYRAFQTRERDEPETAEPDEDRDDEQRTSE